MGYYAVTSGALAVLQAVDPAAPRWLEITVLVGSSLLGTVGRFVVLRAWVFRRPHAAEHDHSSA